MFYIITNKRGQLAGWEAVIIIALIAYSGFITYKWAMKATQTQVFQTGSQPYIPQIKTAPFSCVREGELDDLASKTNHK